MKIGLIRPRTDATEHWKITDVLTKANGEVVVLEHENTVVEGLGRLLGALLFGSAGYSNTAYIAVGSGNVSWDSSLPSPSTTEVKLTSELSRKLITSKSFVDAGGADTASITNRVRFTVDFSELEAIGDIREFGLFSGNATEAKDSGIMCNKLNHKRIIKDSGDLLTRTVIIQL